MVFQPIPQWCLPFPVAFAARSGLHLITNITSESPLGVVEPQELWKPMATGHHIQLVRKLGMGMPWGYTVYGI